VACLAAGLIHLLAVGQRRSGKTQQDTADHDARYCFHLGFSKKRLIEAHRKSGVRPKNYPTVY
jgi:hypothetical protein